MTGALPITGEALAYAEGFQAALKQVENSEVARLIEQVNALSAQLAFERAQVATLEASEAEAAKLIERWMALEAKAQARVGELEKAAEPKEPIPMAEEDLFTAKEVFACLEMADAIALCYGNPTRNGAQIHAQAMAHLRAFARGTPAGQGLRPGTADSDVNVAAIPFAARKAWEKAMES